MSACPSPLAIDDQPLTFLDGRHPLQRVYLDSRDFAPSPLDEQAWVHLVWGLGDGALDTSALNLLRNRTSTGEPIRDADFALDAPAQRHLLAACEALRASPLVHPPLELVRGTAAVETVACWPEAFRAHLASRGKPFPSEDAAGDLLAWLGAELDADEAAGIAHAGDVGFRDDGTLAYVQLRAQTQLNQLFPHSAAHLRDEYTAWQALVGGLNAAAPPTMRRAVQTFVALDAGPHASTFANKWVFATLHGDFVRLAASGLASGLAVCLLALLVSTRSAAVALVSTAALSLVVAGAVSTLVACGWAIGMVEALCLMIVSGLTVDYVLHVAHAFAHAPGLPRRAAAPPRGGGGRANGAAAARKRVHDALGRGRPLHVPADRALQDGPLSGRLDAVVAGGLAMAPAGAARPVRRRAWPAMDAANASSGRWTSGRRVRRAARTVTVGTRTDKMLSLYGDG